MKTYLPLRTFGSLLSGLAMLLVVAAIGPASAVAQTAKEKARASALLKEGAAFLSDKEYEDALGKFEAAYAVVPSPKILFNVGLANEGLARPVRALRAFNEYLAGATSDTAERRKEATDHIVVLKTKVALVVIQADLDGAHISIDGEDSGTTPLSNAIAVEPGNHQIVVQASTGKPWTQAIKALAGSTMRLDATVKEVPAQTVGTASVVGSSPVPTVANSPDNANTELTASATHPQDDGRFYTKGWFWGVTGAVVVAGVVTAIVLSSGGTTTEYECPAGIPCINR
ncbi:MAG: PEGA domain-containing protein [Deltaproteobacteria bacterium]|nr:PEGA domain-containing protein [Deltaproteobacteria bacterium]